MLLYTAELKRSIQEPLASKKEAVEALLARLALGSCRWAHCLSRLGRGAGCRAGAGRSTAGRPSRAASRLGWA
jgi:hypothetical protein